MKLHLIQLFHTRPTSEYSHCAFTSRALGFANMMSNMGEHPWHVVEYSNEGSESTATEIVPILSKDEHAKLFPALGPTDFHDQNSCLGSDGWKAFDDRVRAELRARVEPGDVVLHPFGRAHKGIIKSFPDQIHIEPFVGYNDPPQGSGRIFESEAWRHYCMGRYETMRNPVDGQLMFGGDPGLMRNYSWVVPNARDEREWPIGDGSGDYALFMGRICDVKGCAQIAEMIRLWEKADPGDPLRFVFAGQGDFDRVASQVIKGIGLDAAKRRLEFVGHVKGRARAELVGNARVMLCPTQYVEPGAGSSIEAMLCGTPVLASAWGCFTEYVIHGVNGWQCRTMADWLSGIRHARMLSRRTVGEIARNRHSFEAAFPAYERIFKQIEARLKGDDSISFDVP